MYIATYSEARNNLKSVIDMAIDDVEPVIIHRKNAENAVLMSQSHYDSLMETLYLLSSQENAKRLRQAMKDYRAGLAQKRD
ncbi:type II toxin-antitoxin system Phd/YefM family antitoxin [Lonepinella sp. BR2271]|uniref:type II toxin-antitoxin system Phd/YefM family antitoxin n=1 Tax=Lonepinella sp. BR2271 TaxID=3434550 RepID=UPI003F6DFD49